MSPPGRPKGEFAPERDSAQGNPLSPPGRPNGEFAPERDSAQGSPANPPGRPKGESMLMQRRSLMAFALAFPVAMSGCVPAVIAVGAGSAALVATDRRTAGTQVDDEGVELKISNQVTAQFGDRVHVNVTCYNGVVLLTGEVPDQGVWASIGAIAKGTEKVRVIHNELVVAPNSALSARTNDTYITSKVKARFVEANKFPPNAVKVVTERAVVYLIGIVTRGEGAAAGEIAATTEGVARVVKVFEYRA